MVFLKVSLLGYNKLIVLDIDAGVAAWTGGGGGGGGGSPKIIIPDHYMNVGQTSIEQYFNFRAPLFYENYESQVGNGRKFVTYVDKATYGGEEHIRYIRKNEQKNGAWSFPLNTYGEVANTLANTDANRSFAIGGGEIIRIYVDYANNDCEAFVAFMTKAFNFNNFFSLLSLGNSASIEYPIPISAIVYSSDITTDSTGTDATFTKTYSSPTYPNNFTYNSTEVGSVIGLQYPYVIFGQSAGADAYYIGLKSNNSIVLWFKRTRSNIYLFKQFFDFHTVFPDFY